MNEALSSSWPKQGVCIMFQVFNDNITVRDDNILIIIIARQIA